MKIRYITLFGFFISIAFLMSYANELENGDSNAVSMYLVVFLGPIIFLVFMNALYLKLISGIPKKITKSILSFIPCIPLLASGGNDIRVGFIDGNLGPIFMVVGTSVFISNLMGVIILWSKESKVEKP